MDWAATEFSRLSTIHMANTYYVNQPNLLYEISYSPDYMKIGTEKWGCYYDYLAVGI